ncbi:MAG: FAD-binding oxidoreductase [Sedimentitalea sp.]
MMDILKDLRHIVGERHVLVAHDQTVGFSTDVTGKWVGQVRAVVRPANTSEVAAVMRLAYETGTPVIPQGGNTGLTGATCADAKDNAILLSLARLNTIRDIRPDSRTAIVEAGVVLETLHRAVAQHGLIYPMTFGAKGSCTIGGNMGTNAGGSNVLRYGNTRDLVLGIEAVLPDGEIVDLMSELHKDNTGYNLKHLLIGAEGTLGIITAAVVKLKPQPRAYFTAMVAVPDIPTSLVLLNRLQEDSGNAVEAFEYMPAYYFNLLCARFPETRLPFGTNVEHGIFLEVGLSRGDDVTPDENGALPGVARLESLLMELLEAGDIDDAVVCKSEAQRGEMWQRRERAYESTVAHGVSVDCDISLALDGVDGFLKSMDVALAEIAPGAETMAVAHLGDGNLHYSIWPMPGSDAPIPDPLYTEIMEQVENTVLGLRGSFSAEHGIGLMKLPSMERRKDKGALRMMWAIKAALDPKNIMNPGKVLPPLATQ